MSRNKQYEQNQKAKGLMKKTLWIPMVREFEFEQLAKACCERRNLTFNTLRDTATGKYVSLERF
ncbi:TPA: hypothetical protein ACGVAQ_003019 [Vibrio vulnificus]